MIDNRMDKKYQGGVWKLGNYINEIWHLSFADGY